MCAVAFRLRLVLLLPGSQQPSQWRSAQAPCHSATHRASQSVRLTHRQGGCQDQRNQRGEFDLNKYYVMIGSYICAGEEMHLQHAKVMLVIVILI